MLRARITFVAFGFIVGAILSGCGSSGGGNDGGSPVTGLSDAEAKQVAMDSLAKIINTVATAVDSVDSTIMTARSTQVVAKTGVLNLPVADSMKQNILTQASKQLGAAKQRVAAARSRSAALHDGHGPVTPKETVTANEIADYLVLQSRDGNVLTYTLNPATACDADDTTCLDNLARVTVVQTIAGADSGTLDIRVDNHIAFTIGYAASSIYLQIDLAELKAIAESEGTAEFSEVTAFEGQIRLTLAVQDATAGAEQISIGVGIPKAIKITGVQNKQNVGLDVAASDTVLELAADAGTDTATIKLGLGTLHLLYVDGAAPTVFHLGGLTGVFTFDADRLVATNVGVGGEIYSDAGADGTQDDRIQWTNLNFTVDGASNTLTLDSALDYNESHLAPASTLTATAPTGTGFVTYEIVPLSGIPYTVWNITAGGPLLVTGTGTLNSTLSVSAGMCFRENPVAGVFPVVTATCPAL